MKQLYSLFLTGLCLAGSATTLAAPNPELSPASVLTTLQPGLRLVSVSNHWQAGPMQLQLSHLTDQLGQAQGVKETQVSVSMPLHSSAARRHLSQLDQQLEQQALLQQQLSALQLMAQLRQHWADLSRLALQQQFYQQQLSTIEPMLDWMQQAVRNKEKTRLELMQLQQFQQQLRADAELASQQYQLQQQAYQQLTQQRDWPAAWQETEQQLDWQQHPALRLALLQAEKQEAAYTAASADDSPWTVGLTSRQLQPAVGTNEVTVGLAVSIPFGKSSSDASTVMAQDAMHQAQQQLFDQQQLVRTQVQQARQQLAASRLQATQAALLYQQQQQMTDLARAAWKAGEMASSDWLRIEQQQLAAALANELAQLNVAAAIANWNQAGGLLWSDR